MNTEISMLQAKAEQGDVNAMLKMGISCAQEGNPQQAAYWWEQGASKVNADSTSCPFNCAYNLVYFIYGGHCQMPDVKKFLFWLEKLADYDISTNGHRGWAKIILGTIYCGAEMGIHPVCAEILNGVNIASVLKNPKKGIDLIDEGIAITELGNCRPLDYHDYCAIGEAYRDYGRKMFSKADGYEGAKLEHLEKSLKYYEKAHELFPSDYPNVRREVEVKLIQSIREQISAALDIHNAIGNGNQ